MKARSAVTISRSQQEVAGQLHQAEAPLTDDGVEISYAEAPGDRGTEMRVVLDQSVPGGPIGKAAAAVVGSDPQRRLDDALRRFKQLVETGEVVRSNGSPEGTDAKRQRMQQPAQPSDSEN